MYKLDINFLDDRKVESKNHRNYSDAPKAKDQEIQDEIDAYFDAKRIEEYIKKLGFNFACYSDRKAGRNDINMVNLVLTSIGNQGNITQIPISFKDAGNSLEFSGDFRDPVASAAMGAIAAQKFNKPVQSFRITGDPTFKAKMIYEISRARCDMGMRAEETTFVEMDGVTQQEIDEIKVRAFAEDIPEQGQEAGLNSDEPDLESDYINEVTSLKQSVFRKLSELEKAGNFNASLPENQRFIRATVAEQNDIQLLRDTNDFIQSWDGGPDERLEVDTRLFGLVSANYVQQNIPEIPLEVANAMVDKLANNQVWIEFNAFVTNNEITDKTNGVAYEAVGILEVARNEVIASRQPTPNPETSPEPQHLHNQTKPNLG